jgi:hypothetical protein
MLHLFCALNMKFICGSRPQQWEKKDHNHTKHSVEVILKTRSNAFRSKVSDPRSSARKVDQSARARGLLWRRFTHLPIPSNILLLLLSAAPFCGSDERKRTRSRKKSRSQEAGRGGKGNISPPPFSFLAAARFPFATGRPIPVDPFVESSGQ